MAVVTAGSILLFILLYLMGNMASYQRKKNNISHAAVCNKLHELERNSAKIAMDLHDDIGNAITAVRIHVDSLPQTNELVTVSSLLGEIVEKVRGITAELLPEMVERVGLLEAVQNLFSSVPIRGYVRGTHIKMAKEKEVQLFRIVQELLGNTLKHAQATEINIVYEQVQNSAVLSYRDNGIGFNRNMKTEGLGLRNIEIRSYLVQACVYLHTAPGKGTSWRFEIPLS